MDKQKVKIILIALAVLLAIFLLYRVASKASDNKLDLANKKANAEADLNILRAQDEYDNEKLEQQMSMLENKIDLITETQKADGISSLDEYLLTLPSKQKDEYTLMRNKFIKETGKNPQLMPYDTLKEWYDNYIKRENLLAEYGRWNGDVSLINLLASDYDTVTEMQSLVENQKALVIENFKIAWRNAYQNFLGGDPDSSIFGVFGIELMDKWLPEPNDLVDIKPNLVTLYSNFQTRKKDIEVVFNSLWAFFDGKKFADYDSFKVKRFIDVPSGTYTSIMAMSPNEIRLMSKLLASKGGVKVSTRISGRELSQTRTVFTNWADVMEQIGRLRADRDGESQNKYETYLSKMPYMKAIRDRFRAYPGTSVSEFNFNSSKDVENYVIDYSIKRYGLTNEDVAEINAGAKVEDIFEFNFLSY